jgi:hypothetical protein
LTHQLAIEEDNPNKSKHQERQRIAGASSGPEGIDAQPCGQGHANDNEVQA